jgi:positive regulator of sigma E activity
MIKETVQVTKVIGEKVEISFTRHSACGSCTASSVCRRGNERLLIDRGGFALAAGDKVDIQISEKRTVLAAILTFALPAALLVGGLIIFKDRGELTSFLLALLIVSLYYVVLKLILLKYAKTFEIRIIDKVLSQQNNQN